MNILLLSLLLTAPTGSTTEQSTPQIAPLRNAHAHNDYRHQRPLLDALDQGFCSVEADIFLADGKLLVGHDRQELTPDRTLQSLYLDPLRRRAAAGNGRVFPDGPSITLLIDIKSDGATTYAALRTVLAEYAEILTTVQGEKLTQKAVTIVISGNRAEDKIANDTLRYAGIDGRLGDLKSDSPAHLVPLISDNWTRHFSWRGTGVMPPAERKKLHDIVAKAHGSGRRVRFWATPESEQVWSELLEAGVDLIGTDDLERLNKFLTRRR